MTFESGFMAFTLLFIVVVIGLVADATFRNPPANRWHKPVGGGIMGLLTVLAAGLAWWWLGGGK